MRDFIEYIETSCAKLPDNHLTYLYKKHILDEMTDRANEVTHSGLKDEKVLADLMTDGCNMGVKSLNRYLNQYKAADEYTKDITKRLINLEQQLTLDMRQYL